MKTTVVLAGIVLGATTLSADTVVGRLENGGADVGAGETQAVTSPLAISADGTFIKTGAGTLNLPFAACETVPNRLSYHALDGTLNLTDDAVAAPPLVAPDFLAEKAAAWFSAADGDYITVSGENVVNWYDVRETDAGCMLLTFMVLLCYNHIDFGPKRGCYGERFNRLLVV